MSAVFTLVFVKRHVCSFKFASSSFDRCRWRPAIRQLNQANLGNSFRRLQCGQYRRGHTTVDLYHRERIVLSRPHAAAQGKVRNIHLMLPENGADPANYARHVEVTDEQQRSVQRGFDIDAVAGEQPRGTAMEDRGARSSVSSARMQGQLEHRSRAARPFFLLVFMDPDAALSGDGKGIDP